MSDPPSTATAPAPAPAGRPDRSSSTVQWVETTDTIPYQGIKRTYLVYRPPAEEQAQPIPILIELAGCCLPSVQLEAERADFRQVAGPAILVYPSYVDAHWNAGACCGTAQADGIDDAGFIKTVIAAVRADNPEASTGRVYLAGYSNGGKLAMMLACQEPSLFSAVAVYGATRTSACSGPGPVSVLIMAGTADPEDAVSGSPVTQDGFTEPTVDQLAASYRSADGCGGESTRLAAGSMAETVWDRCRGDREVGVALWSGENHSWPEATSSTPSAQQVMWDWFTNVGRR